MKVYLDKYRDHWTSPYKICETICFWREIDYDEPWVKRANKVLGPIMCLWQSFLDTVHPPINYVKIDHYDVWSMDSTLSPIILPMLKELKRVKHGAPFVDDEDVPPKLRARRTVYKGNADPALHQINDDVDKKFFKRFDYILDEMIWTFEQLCMDDHEAQFYDHTESRKETDLMKSVRKIKVDRVGLKKHNDRIDNGLRLFGKYFRALWD